MKLSELLEYLQPFCSVRLELVQIKDNKEELVTDAGLYDINENIPKLFLDLEVKKYSIAPYYINDIGYISIEILDKGSEQKKNLYSRYAVKVVTMNGDKPENAYIITPPLLNEYQAGLYVDGKYKDIEYQKFDIVRLVEE